MKALQDQLEYLEAASPFYRERLRGVREQVRTVADLPRLPFTTKEELREGQRRDPPFGPHLCAPPERLVRMHVTSGTTGDPVAVGFTRRDHEANSAVGGEAFRIAGLRPDDTVAHCLNYALYAGGIADHMALEGSGATVVPVGTGQSRRLLDLIPRLGISAIFGTLSFPAYLADRAREAGVEPRELGLRHIVTAGEAGAGLAAVRREIEEGWGVTVADSFGMSDMWSTMGGACGEGEGLHLTVEDHAVLELIDPDSGETIELEDGASGELVWTHLRREASPLLRYRSSDLGRVWTAPCPCGRTSPRIEIGGRRDDMLRVQAVNVYPQAIGAIVAEDERLGRHCVVADGDPIVPPLELYVEAPAEVDLADLADRLHTALRTRFEVGRLEPGTLPVAEQKTRNVHRTARGDALPPAVQTRRARGAGLGPDRSRRARGAGPGPDRSDPPCARGRAWPGPERPAVREGPGLARTGATLEEGARSMTVTTAAVGVARVIIWDRQARRNAWDLATMTAIADAIEAAGADRDVRCVVLRGAGEHFSAGDDLHAAIEADTAAWTATIEGFQRLTRVVLAAPVPAIAAVDGVCVGGALEFAASCDLRLCTDRVRLITPEVGIGLTASNAGTLLLPEVLGETAARELLLGGQSRDAAWAGRHGFATELVAPEELDARVEHWAGVFSQTSRDAVAATKAMLNERFGDLLAAAMDRETHHCVRLFDEPDARAALGAFAERGAGS